MKKKILVLITLFIILIPSVILISCGKKQEAQPKPQEQETEKPKEIEQTITKAKVVELINNKIEEEKKEYEFNYNLNLVYRGLNATANYNCEYIKDEDSELLKRKTSGILLKDGTLYIDNSKDNKIKVHVDKDGKTDKVSAILDENDLKLTNVYVENILKSINEKNIKTIKKSNDEKYDFCANIVFNPENEHLKKIIVKIENIGGKLNFKNVTLNNPANGIEVYFKLNNEKKLFSFAFKTIVQVYVKGEKLNVNINYEQNFKNIKLKEEYLKLNKKGFITDINEIKETVNLINNSIEELGELEKSTIDCEIENILKCAKLKDKKDGFKSKLSKNKSDFNFSYEYNLNTDEDGKEKYKYTIGNLKDNSVYLLSRKGKNKSKLIEKTYNDIYKSHISGISSINADEVEVIKKEGSEYTIYLKDSVIGSYENRLVELLNKNSVDDAIEINNNYNKEHIVKKSNFTIKIENNKVKRIELKNEISYIPELGDYQNKDVSLKSSFKITVADKFTDFTVPTKPSKLSYIL